MDVTQLVLPALYFEGHSCGVVDKPSDLVWCTPAGLKHGFYNGLSVIDALGREYRIVEARKVGNVGRFWGWGYHEMGSRGLRIFMRLIEVELVFEEGFVERSLSDAQNLVWDLVVNDPDGIWEENMWADIGFKQFGRKLKAANDFVEVFNLLR